MTIANSQGTSLHRASQRIVVIGEPRYPDWHIGVNAHFAWYANRVANRCRGRVKAYELWNEPNLSMFW